LLLRHATLRRNLQNIEQFGLLANKSKGRMPVVWLHTPSRTAWALLHTVKRHGGRVEDCVVIELDVPRSWLRRARKRLWHTSRNIPPARFIRVIDFGEVAGPSTETAA
jgi:hypothetical protein